MHFTVAGRLCTEGMRNLFACPNAGRCELGKRISEPKDTTNDRERESREQDVGEFEVIGESSRVWIEIDTKQLRKTDGTQQVEKKEW